VPKVIHYKDSEHRGQVVALWQSVFGYETAHNEPVLAIMKKLAVQDGLFFVATDKVNVVGTVLAGYDGHRGWLYSVAVDSSRQRQGIGRLLVKHAERALCRVGCMKVNLQLLASNESTASFYTSLGYSVEPRVSMGRLLPENIPRQA
jgi:ribosomal protein S18 acetylase RimI-like enzyme